MAVAGATGVITSAELADNAVTTDKLKNDAVTNPKIVDGTVTNAKIADTAGIVSSKLATPGQVLQVIQSVKTDTFTSSVDETFTDITGLSVLITPSSTISKILINVTLAAGFRPAANAIMFRLLRDSTAIAIGDAASNRNRTTLGDAIVSNDSITNATISFVDSPSTTSATTYKVQFWQDSPASAIFVNRSVTDSDIAAHQRCISQITATEIAG